MQFWRELKGRVADPDPAARAPMTGEVRSADDRIVSWQSRPLPDGATLIAFADITDTRQLEGALASRNAAFLDAERLKRDFVGNVSYELRTPLTTILGYAQMLQGLGETVPERGRNYVAAVLSAADQLASSIDDILHMAAVDADEVALDMEDVSVPALLEGIVQRWSEKAAAARLTISLDCAPNVGLIRADAARLTQVLDHLVENAVRQTPPGGAVTLAAVREDGEVKISVSDTGRGIAFHVQAKIFDRFSGREGGGPGLGLALVKALTELHGGWVELVSEPGHGATFTCHLPEAAQPAAAVAELGF
jgi:signal transduction histidine kinase